MGPRLDERLRAKRLGRRGLGGNAAAGAPRDATGVTPRQPPTTPAKPTPAKPTPAKPPVEDAVLFLDGLGTLNGARLRARRGDDAIDPASCAAVNAIVAATGARVVVSSSWRHEAGCRGRLLAGGLADAFHDDWATGATVLLGPRRGLEIAEWLGRHPEVTRYVVLDDDARLLRGQRGRLVPVDHAIGMTGAHATMAIAVLGEGDATDAGAVEPDG